MRKTIAIILACCLCFALTACGCAHQYETKVTREASCTSSGVTTHTCKLCGYTYSSYGSIGNHSWVLATCTKEQYCSSCGITNGNALGHTTQNGKCGRCGEMCSNSKLIVKNALPCTVTTYFSTGNLYATVTIDEIKYVFKDQSDGKVQLFLELSCYVDAVGKNSNQAIFGIKLYDSEGKLIDTQNVLKSTAAEGLYFTAEESFKDLKPGNYTIEITPRI